MGCLIIGGVVFTTYKPVYKVKFQDEAVGYVSDKKKMEEQINHYLENGDDENVSFVHIDQKPKYTLCLAKRNIETSEEEILNKIKEAGQIYYKYYAIVLGMEEKTYVSTFEEAEQIINTLKEKDGQNAGEFGFVEIYKQENAETVNVDIAVENLYVEKVVVATQKPGSAIIRNKAAVEVVKTELGISLVPPISGVITSRYGPRRGGTHHGLDIAAPTGTQIKAASSGIVTFSGWDKNGLGYCIKVDAGDGIEIYYGHCSKLFAVEGDVINPGDIIALVGSTGRSSGPHLHLEIRVNGKTVNPQNYLY